MAVNFSASFAKDERPLNGLEAIAHLLADESKQDEEYTVIGRVKPKFVKLLSDDGTRTPTVRHVHIEVVFGEAAFTVERLLKERHRERLGRDVEPAPAEPEPDLFSSHEDLGSVKEPDRWLGEPDPDAWKPSDRPEFKAPESADGTAED
jgi:hypothetical protein